jgi:DNA-binding NarL/FixJ family response regulator
MTTRVLIVEDHSLLRKGLRSMIAGLQGYAVVGEAADGKDGIREAVSLRPDLVLMDLSMPGMTGLEATTQIKQRLPTARVIVLTIYQTGEFIREALRAGADGYVLKGTSYEEFVLALDSVVAGKKFLCQDVSMQLVDNYLHPDGAPPAKAAWTKLTARERSILKLVAEGRTNRATGEFLCISPKTVEKHRANLMRKLGLRNAAELTLMAIDMGLIERPMLNAPHAGPAPASLAPDSILSVAAIGASSLSATGAAAS